MKNSLVCIVVLCSCSLYSQKIEIKTTKKIINGVKKKNVGIYKMFAWRYPTYFNMYVNGQKIGQNETIEVPANTKDLTVSYDYEWYTPWGNKSGNKKALFKLSESAPSHSLSFSGWKNNNRIQLSNAQKLSKEVPVN